MPITNNELRVLLAVARSQQSTAALAARLGISRFAADRALKKLRLAELVDDGHIDNRSYFLATSTGLLELQRLRDEINAAIDGT